MARSWNPTFYEIKMSKCNARFNQNLGLIFEMLEIWLLSLNTLFATVHFYLLLVYCIGTKTEKIEWRFELLSSECRKFQMFSGTETEVQRETVSRGKVHRCMRRVSAVSQCPQVRGGATVCHHLVSSTREMLCEVKLLAFPFTLWDFQVLIGEESSSQNDPFHPCFLISLTLLSQ